LSYAEEDTCMTCGGGYMHDICGGGYMHVIWGGGCINIRYRFLPPFSQETY
jgi:hypothetical protein